MQCFRTWLDGVAPAGRPVLLVGFIGGAAFAGGLVLADPDRYAGAAILYGTLPFDAGVPVTPSRLAHVPVFVAQGDADQVIPRELLDRTWSYLLTESGAATEAHRDLGGHGHHARRAAPARRLAAGARRTTDAYRSVTASERPGRVRDGLVSCSIQAGLIEEPARRTQHRRGSGWERGCSITGR
jgi:poly(3-hydroxybutyrate) depolymerase